MWSADQRMKRATHIVRLRLRQLITLVPNTRGQLETISVFSRDLRIEGSDAQRQAAHFCPVCRARNHSGLGTPLSASPVTGFSTRLECAAPLGILTIVLCAGRGPTILLLIFVLTGVLIANGSLATEVEGTCCDEPVKCRQAAIPNRAWRFAVGRSRGLEWP